MLNKNQTGLEIFDNFIVDTNLPKYNKKDTKFINSGSLTVFTSSSDNTISMGGFISSPSTIHVEKNRWFKTFIEKLSLKAREWKKISVNEFFNHIKNTTEEISIIQDRKESYLKAIEHAKKFGQIALVEKLERMVDVVRQETQLLSVNLKTIISENQIITFYKDCKKGLKLTWIKNYTRLIPQEFLKIKMRCDELEIFDNYVVLHYDPHGKSSAMTEKEKKDQEDPILFGVLNHSRKLYYIGDWTDDCCDLTMMAFIDKFGINSLEKISSEIKIKC